MYENGGFDDALHTHHQALDIRAATSCGDTPSQFEAFREKVPLGQSERVWT